MNLKAKIYPTLLISGWFDTSHWSSYFYILAIFFMFGCSFAIIGYLVSSYVLKNVPVEK